MLFAATGVALSPFGLFCVVLQFDDDKAVYDEVNEKDYEKIVAQRRADNDFVVDDEGLGYADDGEEHMGRDDSDADEESDDGEDIGDELDELIGNAAPSGAASGSKGESGKEKRKGKISAAAKLKSGKGAAGLSGMDAFVGSGLSGSDVVKGESAALQGESDGQRVAPPVRHACRFCCCAMPSFGQCKVLAAAIA